MRKQLYSGSSVIDWDCSQLAGLGELPLLGVDGLGQDLVPRGLSLHQLEPETGDREYERHSL